MDHGTAVERLRALHGARVRVGVDGDLFEGTLAVEDLDHEEIRERLERPTDADPDTVAKARARAAEGSFLVNVGGTPLVFDRADFESATEDDGVLEVKAAGATVRIAKI